MDTQNFFAGHLIMFEDINFENIHSRTTIILVSELDQNRKYWKCVTHYAEVDGNIQTVRYNNYEISYLSDQYLRRLCNTEKVCIFSYDEKT